MVEWTKERLKRYLKFYKNETACIAVNEYAYELLCNLCNWAVELHYKYEITGTNIDGNKFILFERLPHKKVKVKKK